MRRLLGSILVAAITTAAEAQTVHKVPGNYPTIQAAINAAQAGDTVRVAPGTYIENINFSGKAITVVSEAGPNVTTIDGNQANSVVRFISGEGPNSIIEGFTVRNGDANQNGTTAVESIFFRPLQRFGAIASSTTRPAMAQAWRFLTARRWFKATLSGTTLLWDVREPVEAAFS